MTEFRYCLRGEIDLASKHRLRQELAEGIQSGGDVLVDCAQLTFIDSTGVRELWEAHEALEAGGRRLLLVDVPEPALRVFTLLGLTSVLHIEPAGSRPPDVGRFPTEWTMPAPPSHQQ